MHEEFLKGYKTAVAELGREGDYRLKDWSEPYSYLETAYNNMLLINKPISTDPIREPLLQEREKTHGNYQEMAQVAEAIRAVCSMPPCLPMSRPAQRLAMQMICVKMARILVGDARFKDHWDDIAGYAKLGSEACDG